MIWCSLLNCSCTRGRCRCCLGFFKVKNANSLTHVMFLSIKALKHVLSFQSNANWKNRLWTSQRILADIRSNNLCGQHSAHVTNLDDVRKLAADLIYYSILTRFLFTHHQLPTSTAFWGVQGSPCIMSTSRDANQIETQNDRRLDELHAKVRTLRGVRSFTDSKQNSV